MAGKFFLSPWLPLLFTVLALVGLAGLLRAWPRIQGLERAWLALLLFHTLLIVPLLATRLFLSAEPLEVAQGRHFLIPAASAISILLVWGWEEWQRRMSQVVVAGLLLWSAFGQLAWAAVTYPEPMPVWAGEAPAGMMASVKPVGQSLVDGVELTGAAWQVNSGEPSLEVVLWWKSMRSMPEDYLIELTLLDAGGQVVSWAVDHPIGGRYPTRAWEPGDVIKDTHWLPLVGPLNGTYRLQLRLLTRAAQPATGGEPVALGPVSLSVPAGLPDPCAIWIHGQTRRGGLLEPAYPLRSTFTVIGPDPPRLEPLADRPTPVEPKPFMSAGDFHIFLVAPDWAETYPAVSRPAVAYRLRSTGRP